MNAQGFARDDAGATIVEFALVTPVLILCLVACFDFARAVNAYVTIANAAREGVRYAATTDGSTSASIRDYLASRVAPLDPSPASMGISLVTALDPSAGSWSLDAPRPTKFTVHISYQWHASTWLIGEFFAATSGSPTFASSATMEAMR